MSVRSAVTRKVKYDMGNAFERWKASREEKAWALRARQVATFAGDAPTSATTSSASAAALLGAPRPVGMGRWRVERAGSLTGGWGVGWLAYNSNGDGAWFATWREAMAFALGQAV